MYRHKLISELLDILVFMASLQTPLLRARLSPDQAQLTARPGQRSMAGPHPGPAPSSHVPLRKAARPPWVFVSSPVTRGR